MKVTLDGRDELTERETVHATAEFMAFLAAVLFFF
jgi:hypothetical protein